MLFTKGINRGKHGIERNQNPIPAKICGWRSLVKTRSVAGGPRAVALKQQALSFGSLVLYFDATVPSRGPDGRPFDGFGGWTQRGTD